MTLAWPLAIGVFATKALIRSRIGIVPHGAHAVFFLDACAVKLRLAILLTGLVVVARGTTLPTLDPDPNYLIQTWETEHGLPENSATSIVQTPDGYLWFGTFNGLVRFNGVGFTVFNPSNTPQLPSAGIVNLHVGRDGRLWISTYRGLVVREGDQWRQLHSEDGWNGDYARTFAERSNGDILITAFNGKLFEFSSGRFAELQSPPGEKGQGYFGGADEDGHWWAVQNKFVGRWENGQWVQMISPPPELAGEAVACAPARDGGLWVLLGVELRKLRRGMEVSRVTLSELPGGTWSLSEDSQGNVWIATHDNGVCRVATNGTLTRWNSARGWFDRGRCVFEDRERNLWLGTSGDGLTRLAPRRFQFFDLHGGRNGQPVQSLSPDANGGLWAGTYGRGLFLLNEIGATNVTLPELTKHQLYLKSVLADHSGRLWLGTSDDAVWLVEKGDLRHLLPAQTGGHNIHALFEDSRGNVWISGGSAVAVFDGKASRGFGPRQGLPVGTVSCFAEDSTGALWLSNGNGVFRREREENFIEVTDATGKPIRSIGCLKADADGSIWLGSADQGLLRWKERKLVVLGVESGFPVAAVHGLVEDNHGFLWMTSIRSVVRARHSDLQALADGRAAKLTCQEFDAGDGLSHGEFTTGRQPTCARDARGRLWFATTRGVAMTDPAALRLNEVPPPVRVEGVSFFRPAPSPANAARMQSRGDVVPSKLPEVFEVPLALPAGSGRIEIQYAALSFVAPDKVRFQVRLEGQNGDWQDAGSRRSAYFHELPPGNHVFRVRAANNDGVWNESGASLAFTVLPFYWQTMWFKVLGLVAFGAVIYGIMRRRLAHLEKARTAQHTFARQLIQSQESERKRVAAELHDGLGQDLLLIKNRLALAATRQADPGELTRQLDAATAAATHAIREVRTIAHALRPPALEQVGLTKAIEWMVEQLGEGSVTQFSAELETIDGLLEPEMEASLFRIIQEGLNNVVRHAGAAQVILEMKQEAGGIRVEMFDDGCGFATALRGAQTGERTGLGLVSMEERAHHLGGELKLQTAPGHGTCWTVRVPLRLSKP